jgi:hypothetical protein
VRVSNTEDYQPGILIIGNILPRLRQRMNAVKITGLAANRPSTAY